MSMKKKFLALALAGMVAMPVVANATQVTGTESETPTGVVPINGSVLNKQGQAPSGTISVELPLSMGFTVNQDGQFLAADSSYQITNNSTMPVKVDITEFRETDNGNTTGITIKANSAMQSGAANEDRATMSLTLTGDSDKVIDMYEVARNQGTAKTLFAKIMPADSATMVLNGIAGKSTTHNRATKVDRSGAQEKFTVRFKITKTV